MVTLVKQVNGKKYTIKGKREFDHQLGWRFKEPVIIKAGREVVKDHFHRKTVLDTVTSSEVGVL